MNEIPVHISYHRQRSSTARIRDGAIYLRISSMVSRREQQEHIDHLLEKMKGSWERQQSKIQLSLRSVFTEGEILLSTGIFYQVLMKKTQNSKVKIQKVGNVLHVLIPVDKPVDFEEAEEALWKFLERDQIGVLKQRLDDLAEEWITERCAKLRLRRTLSRWGSCDKRDRVIMLSTKLLLVEPKLLDYVCVHELAHLKYADHSDLFWDLVSEKMPDWKVQRRRLRKYE
ncbi:MAG: M48 family metallopeptidase [Candidatus Altimarinota bacterium]